MSASHYATFAIRGIGEGVQQRIVVKGSGHFYETDAAPVFGGKDRHPSPLYFLLGALSSCSQVTSQLVAKELNLPLHHFEFHVSGDLDTRALLQGSHEADANFESLKIEAIIDTPASDFALETLKAETERRCPVFQLFQRSGVTIHSQWTRRVPAGTPRADKVLATLP